MVTLTITTHCIKLLNLNVIYLVKLNVRIKQLKPDKYLYNSTSNTELNQMSNIYYSYKINV